MACTIAVDGCTYVSVSHLHAIIVTYRRVSDLRAMLEALDAQTRRPDSLIVVDNDDDDGVRALVEGRTDTTYASPGHNAGPAGGLAMGFALVDRTASDDDLVVFLDDDDPPPDEATLRTLEQLFREAVAAGRNVGCVGTAGARFDRRSGRLRRVADADLAGLVEVDYIGGNQFPTYSVRALRDAGPTHPPLFFGFEELDLGLRIGAHGYQLLVDGEAWSRGRHSGGRTNLSARQAAIGRPRTPWRRYYSIRNFVWIVRRHSGPIAGLRATFRSGLGPAAADLVVRRSPRSTGAALRGVRDGWLGRLGRTVEPG